MKKRVILICAVMMLAAAVLASCSAAKNYGGAYDGANGYAPGAGGWQEEPAPSVDGEAKYNEDLPKEGAEDPSNAQKLIKTVQMTLETTEFDATAQKFETLLKESGGYVENSNVSKSQYNTLRSASYVFRVPEARLDGFVEQLRGSANLLSFNESAQDVTLTYADIEGRLTALRAEQKALETMLEKAENISDIITIQSRLTGVRGEIESYESRLRALSSKIAYSTVTVYLREVEKVTVDEKQLTFREEVGAKFKDNAESLGNYLRGMFVDIIGGLPTFLGVLITILVILLPQALIVLIIVLIVKKSRKKRAAKKAALAAQKPAGREE